MNQLKDFIEKVYSSEALRNEIIETLSTLTDGTKIDNETVNRLLTIAQREGFDLTKEEVIAYFSEPKELNEEELNAVAGGKDKDIKDLQSAVYAGYDKDNVY